MAKRRIYDPINRDKYSGVYPIVLKSSWEENFARIYCDLNDACLEWCYEPLKIPYRDPVTGRQTIYIPDFLLAFRGHGGTNKTALVEIKPLHETLQEHARSRKDAMLIARNLAKWEAARGWCMRRGSVEFCIITEAELFGGVHTPRKRQIRPFVRRRVKT